MNRYTPETINLAWSSRIGSEETWSINAAR
jgi:hypothetical protein